MKELAVQLRTYLAMNESSFKDLAYVFYLRSMGELSIEENKLEIEFQYPDVPTAHEQFKYLVLSRMKQEVKVK